MSSILFVLLTLSHVNPFPHPTLSHIHSPPKLSRISHKDWGSGCDAAMLGPISLRSTLVSVIAFTEIWHPSGDSSDYQLFVWHLPDLVLLYPGAGTYKDVPLDVR